MIVRRGLALATIVLTAAGCARALRPPEPLPRAGSASAPVEDAERLWATREPESVRRAAEAFEARLAAEDRSLDDGIGAVRAWVWLAREHPAADDRKAAAVRAVRAAQWCGEIAPGSPVCAYWLGAALGVQAEQRRATALDALPRIVALFEEARERVPGYEHGGAARALALLRLRAPGFPIGPGDPDRALIDARQAVARAPDHPPNLAALAEALAAVGETSEAEATWRRTEALARSAVAGGDPDAPRWLDEARAALAAIDD